MKAYIIECGQQFIVYLNDACVYQLMTTDLLKLFNSEQPDFSILTTGTAFPVRDSAMIYLFCDPEENSGAMIAERDSEQAQPRILHRHRYQALLNQYS